MVDQNHNLNALFEQLGLLNSDNAIKRFVELHCPLNPKTKLYEANIWSTSQSAFLKKAHEENNEWTEMVKHLDILLRN